MNKQPPPRVYLSGCFRLTEEYASPGQKFRVLSVEASEQRNAESTRCSDTEKQVWLQYIKHLYGEYRILELFEHVEANETDVSCLKAQHFQNEMKYNAAADALKNLLNVLEHNTAKELMRRMGEKPGNED